MTSAVILMSLLTPAVVVGWLLAPYLLAFFGALLPALGELPLLLCCLATVLMALPPLLLGLLIAGGGALTAIASLWIHPDGTLPTPWALALGVALLVSWGVIEPAILAWRLLKRLREEDEQRAADRTAAKATAAVERRRPDADRRRCG